MEDDLSKKKYAPTIPNRLNFLEGFRRIKKVLNVAFVLGVTILAGFRLSKQEQVDIHYAKGGEITTAITINDSDKPSSWDIELRCRANPGDQLVRIKETLWRPRQVTPDDEIIKFFRKHDKNKPSKVIKDTILLIAGWILFMELCQRIPIYIMEGFKKHET